MREALDVQAVGEILRQADAPYTGVDFHPSLGSTNARAAELREPWLVVTTDHQVAGRGRLTRSWEVPDRASIAVSVLVPVMREGQLAGDPGWLPLLTGLAMAQAVEQVTGLHAGLKWPNDVLIREDGWRKACGVLCEMVTAQIGVVVGAGLNVHQRREELPIETATSIELCGVSARREELLAAYLVNLARHHRNWMTGGESLLASQQAYRAHCRTIGAEVTLHRPSDSAVSGLAVAVDDTGRLVLAAGGRATPYAAGDVVHVRGAGAAGR